MKCSLLSVRKSSEAHVNRRILVHACSHELSDDRSFLPSVENWMERTHSDWFGNPFFSIKIKAGCAVFRSLCKIMQPLRSNVAWVEQIASELSTVEQ